MSFLFRWVRWKAPKPSFCPRCKKSDDLVWSNGEWKCAECHIVVEPD